MMCSTSPCPKPGRMHLSSHNVSKKHQISCWPPDPGKKTFRLLIWQTVMQKIARTSHSITPASRIPTGNCSTLADYQQCAAIAFVATKSRDTNHRQSSSLLVTLAVSATMTAPTNSTIMLQWALAAPQPHDLLNFTLLLHLSMELW